MRLSRLCWSRDRRATPAAVAAPRESVTLFYVSRRSPIEPRVRGKEHAVSYNLMVFDATVAPRDRAKFLAWFEKQCEWQESHGYIDSDTPAPGLRKWFQEIIKTFP